MYDYNRYPCYIIVCIQIVGVVRGVTHNGVTEIGPIAVHPDHQGKGVGRQLMTTVESRAKGGKCTVGIVSCRTDVIPFFEHMGFTVHIQKYKSTKNVKNTVLHVYTMYFQIRLFSFQRMISKSIKEVGKLYPDDLGEKVITRNDIELTILMKKKETDGYE